MFYQWPRPQRLSWRPSPSRSVLWAMMGTSYLHCTGSDDWKTHVQARNSGWAGAVMLFLLLLLVLLLCHGAAEQPIEKMMQ